MFRVLFDFILMDLLMPIMNGYDATQEIRSLELQMGFSEADRHYICGFSAEVNPSIEARCTACGMDNIVTKPISKSGFEDLVKVSKNRSNLFGQNKLGHGVGKINLNEITLLDADQLRAMQLQPQSKQ